MSANGPTEPESAGSDAAEVKDKFRQALERKRGNVADRDAAADHLGTGKSIGERAGAKTKRTFRRKSG
jgi:hypothetical protein